ncbi:MAG: hypothetical protein ACPHID_07580 [Thermoplasmatota archaeon]
MESVIRKRVSQVGSGAWSIYLPKKWIDAWSPEQQVAREVDLRNINQSILITPVHRTASHEATVADHPDAVQATLASAYIRGYHDVRLRPATDFGSDTVATARDFLRHLDERLVADCRPEGIGFSLRSDLPPPASSDDVLAILAAKVSEVLRLAADAVQSGGHDADRTLHALRLLRDTQREDVDRLHYQAARLVATLEIPLDSVSRYQLFGLAAAELQRAGEQGVRIAETLLQGMGLTLIDLDYPRSHLLERCRLPQPPEGVSRELLDVCRRGFSDLQPLLESVGAALSHSDVPELVRIAAEATAGRDAIQDAVLSAVAEHWGTNPDTAQVLNAFTASKHATAIQNAFEHVRSICHHAVGLLAAAPS